MAVTANQLIARQDGEKISVPVAASTTLYQGTLSFVDSSGYAEETTGSGANKFAGIVIEQVDNSSGSNGDKEVELWVCGDYELSGSGFTQADVGQNIYATDNYTVTTTAAGGVLIGSVARYVSSTKVVVRLSEQTNTVSVSGVDAVTAAGSAQGDAAALTGTVNVVSGGDDTTGVVLPTAAATGQPVYVLNSGSAGLKIYPASGDAINNGSANVAITILEDTLAILVPTAADNWAATFTANS